MFLSLPPVRSPGEGLTGHVNSDLFSVAGVEDNIHVRDVRIKGAKTNTATSTAITAATMATKVSMETSGKGGLGPRRTTDCASWMVIGSETRRCWI